MSLALFCLRVNAFVNEKRPKRAPWGPEGTAMVVESEPRWTLLHSLFPTPRRKALMIQISLFPFTFFLVSPSLLLFHNRSAAETRGALEVLLINQESAESRRRHQPGGDRDLLRGMQRETFCEECRGSQQLSA